jgi:hypothetical protein
METMRYPIYRDGRDTPWTRVPAKRYVAYQLNLIPRTSLANIIEAFQRYLEETCGDEPTMFVVEPVWKQGWSATVFWLHHDGPIPMVAAESTQIELAVYKCIADYIHAEEEAERRANA